MKILWSTCVSWFLGSTPWPSRRCRSAVVCTGLALAHRRGSRSQMRVVEDTCDLDISPNQWYVWSWFSYIFHLPRWDMFGSPGWVPWFVFFLGVIHFLVVFLLAFGDRSCCWDVETFGTRFLELVSFSFQPFQGDQLQADLSAMAGGYLWTLCTSAGFVLFGVLWQGYVLSSKGS